MLSQWAAASVRPAERIMSETVYKICSWDAWSEAVEAGAFTGSPVDVEDGYIHLSSGAQVAETAEKHFKGQDNLVIVAVDAGRLGADLKWEPSRGGDLFPHLYAPLQVDLIEWVKPLPTAPDGTHELPEGVLQ